jgi:peptidylprolyl isomerase
MEIIIGHEDMLPEVEHAIIGMVAGERKQVVVPQGMGYGRYREELTQVVSRDDFPEGIEPKVGLRLRVPAEGCEVVHATVVKVTGSEITLDQNHPLAGEDVQFEITLLEIVDF